MLEVDGEGEEDDEYDLLPPLMDEDIQEEVNAIVQSIK